MQHMPMMQGMMQGMMQRMSSPAALLDMGDALSLTTEQKAALEELQARAAESHGGWMESARAQRERAAALLEAETPDFDAYEQALTEAETYMARIRGSKAATAARARALLDPEQRQRLDHHCSLMHSMMEGMMMGDGAMMERMHQMRGEGQASGHADHGRCWASRPDRPRSRRR